MDNHALRADVVGVVVRCRTCDAVKKPIGRAAAIGLHYCDDDCPGYRQSPRPGSLWPMESEADFGYAVSLDGTNQSRELDARVVCPDCNGTGSDGYRGHQDENGQSEIEPLRCVTCDGIGRL